MPHRQSVTWTITSSLEMFLTCFRYSYSGGKFKHIYTGIFFSKVTYTRHDVPCFVERMDSTNLIFTWAVSD
jgi:hypothetical protein